MKHLIILTHMPTRLNRLYQPICRLGKPSFIKTKEGREATHYIKAECMRQRVFKPLEGNVSFKMDIDIEKRKSTDIDAYLKLLFDALQGYAYHDDKQIAELIVRKHYDQGERKITISIEEIK